MIPGCCGYAETEGLQKDCRGQSYQNACTGSEKKPLQYADKQYGTFQDMPFHFVAFLPEHVQYVIMRNTLSMMPLNCKGMNGMIKNFGYRNE
jgi:hypothetical protein